MPVLLTEKDFEPWLQGEAGIELLKAAPNGLLKKMARVQATEQLSRASDDDPTLIDPISL
jgi:putative SOS response-associated peptidase YedK